VHNRVGNAQYSNASTTRLCYLEVILQKLALLAYIDTFAVQAKCTYNKLVVHVKITRDRWPLAVTNQKSWNVSFSLNFSGIVHDGSIQNVLSILASQPGG